MEIACTDSTKRCYGKAAVAAEQDRRMACPTGSRISGTRPCLRAKQTP
ncbi:MAG: hypothetical protein ABIH04_03030 [Planctomycetota bacterium]